MQEVTNIMNILNSINYGWIDKQNNIHYDMQDFSNNYKLQSPEEILNSKVGVCWDQVELERFYFEQTNYEIKTFFIVHYDNAACPTHTFLVYKDNDYYYWFEHSWKKYQGIHKYNSLKELLLDVRKKFITVELNNEYEEKNLVIREYEKPKYGINVLDYYKHCEKGKQYRLFE